MKPPANIARVEGGNSGSLQFVPLIAVLRDKRFASPDTENALSGTRPTVSAGGSQWPCAITTAVFWYGGELI